VDIEYTFGGRATWDSKSDVRWQESWGSASVLIVQQCGEEMSEIFSRVVEANDWNTVDCPFGIGRLERSQSKHIVEYFRLAGQDADVESEQGASDREGNRESTRDCE